MNTIDDDADRAREDDVFARLEARGREAEGFAEGYIAREKIIEAGRAVRALRQERGLSRTALSVRGVAINAAPLDGAIVEGWDEPTAAADAGARRRRVFGIVRCSR